LLILSDLLTKVSDCTGFLVFFKLLSQGDFLFASSRISQNTFTTNSLLDAFGYFLLNSDRNFTLSIFFHHIVISLYKSVSISFVILLINSSLDILLAEVFNVSNGDL